MNFDDANLRRSAQAAVAACLRVERALEILADIGIAETRRMGGLGTNQRAELLARLG